MDKVLVTGASGFIGLHCICENRKNLKLKGSEIVSITSFKSLTIKL